MHIPDGYLDPATCAATYLITLAVGVIAFRRARLAGD
jgi:ABC-type Co2+ transport system permease subunit